MSNLVIHLAQPATEHFWPLLPSVVGAVLGAGAAAIPAFLLARKTASDAKQAAAADRVRLRRGFARTAGFKLQSIVNTLYTVDQHLTSLLEEAERNRIPLEQKWRLFKPFMGTIPERVVFSADELSLVYEAGDSALANRIILIADRYFADELGLKDYSDRRRRFADLVDDAAVRGIEEGYVIQRASAVTAELADAANELRSRYGKDFAEARAVFEAFATTMQSLFDDPSFLRIGWADTKRPECQ